MRCARSREVAILARPRRVASSASRPDERRLPSRPAAAGRRERLDRAERLDRLVAAAQRHRPERFVADGLARRGFGRGADGHVAGLAELLEPLRGVHDVAHRGRVAAGSHRAHEHLAAVHADAHLHREVDLLGDALHGLVHAQRGAHGSFGVVLVSDRGAEEGDDLVADDLVEPAAERGDVGHELLEAVVDEALDLLGVGARRQRGEADQVGHQHGCEAAFLERRPHALAALLAEPGPGAGRRPAGGTGHAGHVTGRVRLRRSGRTAEMNPPRPGPNGIQISGRAAERSKGRRRGRHRWIGRSRGDA